MDVNLESSPLPINRTFDREETSSDTEEVSVEPSVSVQDVVALAQAKQSQHKDTHDGASNDSDSSQDSPSGDDQNDPDYTFDGTLSSDLYLSIQTDQPSFAQSHDETYKCAK